MNGILRSNSRYEICDNIEYQTFIKGSCNLSEYAGSYEGDDKEEENDCQFLDILDILKNRLQLYEPYVPFHVEKNKIRSYFINDEMRKQNLYYLFCLFYSMNGGGNNLTRCESTLFEDIVDSALKTYLGTEYSVMTSFGDTELTIKEKIHHLLEKTNETIGNLETLPPHAKDGGIDVVTFKPLDNRGNQIMIFTDATLGKNWKVKRVNSKLKHWKEYIHFKNDPITCLAVAKIIPQEEFHSASLDNGLLFDRARIVQNYQTRDDIQIRLNEWRTLKCDL